MTKDKERDDALIAEKKRLAYFLECKEGTLEAEAMFRRAAVLLRGDEQPKPDRAEVLAEELWPYLRSLSRDRLVPILNRHFDELRAEWEAERPAVVVPGAFSASRDGAKGGAATSIDVHQRRGIMATCITLALRDYDEWQKDDDYNFIAALERVINHLEPAREVALQEFSQ